MSAFLCNDDVFDLLAAAIQQWAVNVYTDAQNLNGRTDYATMADILRAENVKSVNYRYNESTPAAKYRCNPLSLDRAAVAIRPEVLILQAVRCVRYQSCETPEYETSLAHRILEAIQAKAIHNLTSVDDAPWEYTREWSEERRATAKARIAKQLTHA